MFVDGDITKEAFKNMQERYNKEISNLQNQIELSKNPNRSPEFDTFKIINL